MIGTGAKLLAGTFKEVVLLAPVSASFVGSANYGGFGNERGGGEWAHANLAACVGGVVWEGVMGDMENGLNGLFFEAREGFRGEAELRYVREAGESVCRGRRDKSATGKKRGRPSKPIIATDISKIRRHRPQMLTLTDVGRE